MNKVFLLAMAFISFVAFAQVRPGSVLIKGSEFKPEVAYFIKETHLYEIVRKNSKKCELKVPIEDGDIFGLTQFFQKLILQDLSKDLSTIADNCSWSEDTSPAMACLFNDEMKDFLLDVTSDPLFVKATAMRVDMDATRKLTYEQKLEEARSNQKILILINPKKAISVGDKP